MHLFSWGLNLTTEYLDACTWYVRQHGLFFFEAMYLLFIYSVIDHRFITPLHMYISTHYVKHVHLYVCVYVIHARMCICMHLCMNVSNSVQCMVFYFELMVLLFYDKFGIYSP